MGIQGLLTYADNEHLYDEVNIQELADEFRRTNNDDPVIAVDGSPCARHLYGSSDLLCGGQYKHLREACRAFVQKFRDSGVSLCFFFDGVPVVEKVDKWIQRRKQKVREISQAFAKLRGGDIRSRLRMTPEAVVPSARVIFKAELACDVHVATGDCDWELADYAVRNERCIGVLSNDTDFLAHERVPCLFTFDHLLTENVLQARRYKPADIASRLDIPPERLPIFASFMGNDVVDRQNLKYLHKRLESRYNWPKLPDNVAKFVRDGTPVDIPALCDYAFNNRHNDFVADVTTSVNSYRHGMVAAVEPVANEDWGEVLQMAKERHVACQMPAVVYSVMLRSYFRAGEVLEDLSAQRGDSPPTGLILRKMRARLYGVLFWGRGQESSEVTELIPTSMNIREELVAVTKLPSDVHHPGLGALWLPGDVDASQRWKLFSWVTSPRMRVSALRALPPHLVVPAVALSFLRHDCSSNVLREDEAMVFAAVAVVVGDISASCRSGPDVERADIRAVYLATLFVRTLLHVLDAAGACGLSFTCESDCLPDAYFDGRYFHDVYVATMSKSERQGLGSHLTKSDRRPDETFVDPRCFLPWCKSHEAQFQELIEAVEFEV